MENRGELVRNAIFVFFWSGLLFSVSAASAVIGDANGDGKIDQADAQTILQKSVSSVFLGSTEAGLADVNGDGQINALDAILVLKTGAQEERPGLAGFQSVARIDEAGVELELVFDGLSKLVDGPVQVRLMNLAGAVLGAKELRVRGGGRGRGKSG